MSNMSRRKLIATGAAIAAGASGLGVAAKLVRHYGLVPPDAGGIYGAGETLTYAAQRLMTRHSMAREFTRNQISTPFANEVAPLGEGFQCARRGRLCWSRRWWRRWRGAPVTRRTMSLSMRALFGSSPTVGSSKKYTFGSCSNAAHSATFCFMPCE